MAAFSPNMPFRLARQLLGDEINLANTPPSPAHSPFIEYMPNSGMLLSKVVSEEQANNLKTSTLSCSSRTHTDTTPRLAALDLFAEITPQFLLDDNDARAAYNAACQLNPVQALAAYQEQTRMTDAEIIEMLLTKVPQLIQPLAIHPQGNFSFQKLYTALDEEKKIQVINLLSFVDLAESQHGTRSVQKIVLSATHTEELLIQRIHEKLAGHVVQLILNQHGNHCIQKLIEQFQPHQFHFVVEECLQRVVDVSCHQLGCCVLQHLLEHCSDIQYAQLFAEINQFTLDLVTDQFGNYVFQFLLNSPRTTPDGVQSMIRQLVGHEIQLCQLKASSHVMERCIGRAEPDLQAQLVENILANEPSFVKLCCDRFANYVIQKAIQISKGDTLRRMLDAISRNQTKLAQSQYAKHIMQFYRAQQ